MRHADIKRPSLNMHGAVRGLHPGSASACRTAVNKRNLTKKHSQSAHVGQAEAYAAVAWFLQRRHSAGTHRAQNVPNQSRRKL